MTKLPTTNYQLPTQEPPKVFFATDHAGLELKEQLVPFVRDELGYDVEDFGAYVFDESDDYPDFVNRAAQAVSENAGNAMAIILGGSGQGEAIVANRFKNVRATVYYGGDSDIVRLSREHNNANVLSLGARFLNIDDAKNAVKMWLETEFSGDDRHIRRINKIDAM